MEVIFTRREKKRKWSPRQRVGLDGIAGPVPSSFISPAFPPLLLAVAFWLRWRFSPGPLVTKREERRGEKIVRPDAINKLKEGEAAEAAVVGTNMRIRSG